MHVRILINTHNIHTHTDSSPELLLHIRHKRKIARDFIRMWGDQKNFELESGYVRREGVKRRNNFRIFFRRFYLLYPCISHSVSISISFHHTCLYFSLTLSHTSLALPLPHPLLLLPASLFPYPVPSSSPLIASSTLQTACQETFRWTQSNTPRGGRGRSCVWHSRPYRGGYWHLTHTLSYHLKLSINGYWHINTKEKLMNGQKKIQNTLTHTHTYAHLLPGKVPRTEVDAVILWGEGLMLYKDLTKKGSVSMYGR